MPLPFLGFRPVNNSFEQETTDSTSPNTSIPKYHFRDSSDSSDSDEFSTTPTTPTTPGIDTHNNNNNNNTPNLQRRSSESITEAIQFRKVPVRRYTLPSRINPFGLMTGGAENNNRNPLSRFWDVGGRDSSVQVAMENVQFGL